MDWCGTAFILLGLWLIGSKKRTGFILSIIGCVFWAIFGLHKGIPSITIVNIIFIFVNARGWFLWDRNVTRHD